MLRAARRSTEVLVRTGQVRLISRNVPAVGGTKYSQVAVTEDDLPTATEYGQAFLGDLRSVSGLGLGDGIKTHTKKWMDGDHKSPMDYIQEAEPIRVHGIVVASYGSSDHGLGAPVQYISLKGTSRDRPAVCKYTGNKYYSDDWQSGGHH